MVAGEDLTDLAPEVTALEDNAYDLCDSGVPPTGYAMLYAYART